jgi:YidC/Oxa1 family membrane protein insertase
MDTPRVILAIALSLAVLVGWNILFPPAPQTPIVAENQTAAQAPQTAAKTPAPQAPAPDAPIPAFTAAGKRLTVDTPRYRAVINTAGGILESFTLKHYTTTIAPGAPDIDLVSQASLAKAPLGILWDLAPTWTGAWQVQGGDLTLNAAQSGSIQLSTRRGDLEVVRILRFQGDSYAIQEEIRVTNQGKAQVKGQLSATLASAGLSAPDDRYNHTKIAYWTNALEQEGDAKDLQTGIASEQPVRWGSIDSNYFLMAMVPTSGDMFLRAKLEDGVYRVAVTDTLIVDPGVSQVRTLTYYLGPKTEADLAAMPGGLAQAIHYGFFDVIAKPLKRFLVFLAAHTGGNYGVAIIILTVIIKILFWPLSHKSYKSMEQMRRIQPLMAKIREKYADDREKMNAEIMQLYKTYKVNPAGGCLPMLLQIPVFFALYQALLGAIELRHAPFIPHLPGTDIVWLADLSAKDPLYITPLVMGATMFLQQRMTPSAADPTQAKIMMAMPVIFTFLFLSFPSGLVVYWLVNNVLSIFQQWLLTRSAKPAN